MYFWGCLCIFEALCIFEVVWFWGCVSGAACARHSPVGSQVAARVPGGGGGWRADALVVVLHLQADGAAQPPRDVQQPLHDQLPFLLQHTQGSAAQGKAGDWGLGGLFQPKFSVAPGPFGLPLAPGAGKGQILLGAVLRETRTGDSQGGFAGTNHGKLGTRKQEGTSGTNSISERIHQIQSPQFTEPKDRAWGTLGW